MTNLPARLPRLIGALLAIVLATGPAFADDSEKKRRGLKRLVPTPFKKDNPRPEKSDEAVEDMREFTASLLGVTPAKPTTPTTPTHPTTRAPAAPKPTAGNTKPAPVPIVKPGVSVKPEAVEAPAPKKGRRGFFRLPFSSDKKPEAAPLAPTPAAPKPEAQPSPSASPQPAVEKKPPGWRKLIKVPFVGGKDDSPKPESAASTEPAPASEKQKRSPLSRLPFLGKDDAPEPSIAPLSTEEPAADSEQAAIETAEKQRRPRRRLFGKHNADEEPDSEQEIGAIEAPVEQAPREKRKLFSIGKKEGKPEPVSNRDLGTGEKYVVTVSGTPFYSIGPSQPLPPEEILNKGKVVTMRKSGWGWSDIELPGGQMGVVASKNLRKASPTEAGGSWASRRSGGNTRGLFKVLDFNPAPEPELPTDAGAIPLGAGLLPPLHDE